jgi:hypothetical protein
MDQTRRIELGDKLVWHSKGPIETAFEYNGNLLPKMKEKQLKTVACVCLQLMAIPIMGS